MIFLDLYATYNGFYLHYKVNNNEYLIRHTIVDNVIRIINYKYLEKTKVIFHKFDELKNNTYIFDPVSLSYFFENINIKFFRNMSSLVCQVEYSNGNIYKYYINFSYSLDDWLRDNILEKKECSLIEVFDYKNFTDNIYLAIGYCYIKSIDGKLYIVCPKDRVNDVIKNINFNSGSYNIIHNDDALFPNLLFNIKKKTSIDREKYYIDNDMIIDKRYFI